MAGKAEPGGSSFPDPIGDAWQDRCSNWEQVQEIVRGGGPYTPPQANAIAHLLLTMFNQVEDLTREVRELREQVQKGPVAH